MAETQKLRYESPRNSSRSFDCGEVVGSPENVIEEGCENTSLSTCSEGIGGSSGRGSGRAISATFAAMMLTESSSNTFPLKFRRGMKAVRKARWDVIRRLRGIKEGLATFASERMVKGLNRMNPGRDLSLKLV